MRKFTDAAKHELVFDVKSRDDLEKVHKILLDHIVEDTDLTYDTTEKGEGGIVNILCAENGFQKLVEAFKEAGVAPSKVVRPTYGGLLEPDDI